MKHVTHAQIWLVTGLVVAILGTLIGAYVSRNHAGVAALRPGDCVTLTDGGRDHDELDCAQAGYRVVARIKKNKSCPPGTRKYGRKSAYRVCLENLARQGNP